MGKRSRFTWAFLTLTATLSFAAPSRAGEIHDLLKNGEVAKAGALLAKNPALIDTRDNMRQTPLHIAASHGQVGGVKLLIELGADVEARAYNEFTPLHLTENLEIVKLLIAHKADVDAKALGTTALQRAASRWLYADKASAANWRAITKALLDAGARYDLLSATLLDDLDRVKAILKADPKEALDKHVMREAARAGRTTVVKLLLDLKADPNDADYGGLPVLYFALEHPDVVRLLIKAGADVKSHLKDERRFSTGPSFPKGTLLHHAAEIGQVETAKQLIAAGVAIDARDPGGATALAYAAGGGWPEMVKLLLKNKASTKGEDGNTAMIAAASQIRYAEQKAEETARFKAVILILSGEGVPIDLRTAVALGKLDLVQKMLKADPALATANEPECRPILAKAVALDHREIVVALLDAGATSKEEGGATALHWAAFWGREEIAKLLIARRADVNARAKGGRAPLHEAAQCGKLNVARVLLAAGADVNAKDDAGQTPLSRVSESDKEAAELIELFKKYGAKP